RVAVCGRSCFPTLAAKVRTPQGWGTRRRHEDRRPGEYWRGPGADHFSARANKQRTRLPLWVDSWLRRHRPAGLLTIPRAACGVGDETTNTSAGASIHYSFLD